MPTVGGFLRELMDPDSSARMNWDAGDKETAMTEYGLDEDQQEDLLSEDLARIAARIQQEESPLIYFYIWCPPH